MYWQLFISFFKVGLLGFGGGLSIIALLEREVTKYGWMSSTEFVDVVAISQITPGPVGLNCATYVGYTATGSIWGSLLASFAIILPSLIIMIAICALYMKIRDRWSNNRAFQITMRIIRILVVALIASAAIRMCTPASFIDWKSWAIFGVTAALMLVEEVRRNKLTSIISNPIVLLIIAGGVGYVLYG